MGLFSSLFGGSSSSSSSSQTTEVNDSRSAATGEIAINNAEGSSTSLSFVDTDAGAVEAGTALAMQSLLSNESIYTKAFDLATGAILASGAAASDGVAGVTEISRDSASKILNATRSDETNLLETLSKYAAVAAVVYFAVPIFAKK
nr:hypothetical protein 12 [bacterium]